MARGRSAVRRTVRSARVAAAERSLSRLTRLATQDGQFGGTRGLTSAETERERAARLSLRQRAASASKSRARAAIGPGSKGPSAGQWSNATIQQTSSKSSSRMGRKTTAAQTALKLTRSQLETVLYRWNGVKSFDSYGNYWLNNRVVTAGRRDLPMYMFDLTSLYANPYAVNVTDRLFAAPFLQMTQEVATGNIAFDPRGHTGPDGVLGSAGTSWSIEKTPTDTSALGIIDTPPCSKSFLKSLSIKMNCWGAKTKAAQYTIQLVKFLDDELVPSHAGYAADILLQTKKRNDFYQNLIKTLTFNPIAQTGGSYKGRMKVLKSETFTIQPNSLDDGDTDPNVRTVSMFVAMNRIISYQESAVSLGTDVLTSDNAAFAQQGVTQFKPQTRPKSRVYLMIRCSNYKLDTLDSNTDTPSFDLMIRSNHQVTI